MYSNGIDPHGLNVLFRSESLNNRCSIDEEVERVTLDLLDRIVSTEKSSNALSLLQNFVIKQIPSSTLSDNLNRNIQIDLNNNCDDDDEMSNPSTINSTDEKQTNPNESPLVSLQKMLSYPSTNIESSSTLINEHRLNKKKFDKYRLFAEKMLRSTLS